MMTTQNMMTELKEQELETVAAGGVNILRSVPTKDSNDSAIQKPDNLQVAQGRRFF